MAIGKIKFKNFEKVVEVPIFELGTSGSEISEFLRVKTENSIGYIPLGDSSNVQYPYLKVMTEEGIKAIHTEASLQNKYVDWSTFSPAPPNTINCNNGKIEVTTVSRNYPESEALKFVQDASTGSSRTGQWKAISREVDLTNKSTMYYSTKLNPDGPYDQLEVRVAGDKALSTDSQHDWTDRTYDVSSYSGKKDLEIGHKISRFNTRELTSWTADLYFE